MAANYNKKIVTPPSPPPLPVFTNPYKWTYNFNNHSDTSNVCLNDELKELWAANTNRVARREPDYPKKYCHVLLKAIAQDGPKCGLVALAMALTSTPLCVSVEEIYSKARACSFTNLGEMFSVKNMADLARQVVSNYLAVEMLTGGMEQHHEFVISQLYRKALLLVPYDTDKNHWPCCMQGHKSHWAVVNGVVEADDTKCFLLAMQGKSRHQALWPYRSLAKSNANLVELDPTKASDSESYVIPEGGIKEGLAGKFIMLRPLTS